MDTKEIQAYLDEQGRVKQMPAKRKRKLLMYCYLVEQIPRDVEYSEKEFSQLLNTMHTFGDAATLRREMFDYYLINRSQDGKHYTLNPDRPTIEELISKYCG